MIVFSLSSSAAILENAADFIFEVLKKAIEFYEDRFKIGYQFEKYDTVFCH